MERMKTLFFGRNAKQMLFVLGCLIFLICSANTHAQSNVRGSVKDLKGESLIGVNVMVKGTGQGTITDGNGEFNLSVSNRNAVLEFSYVGFKTQEISLQGKTLLNVIMAEDTEVLDDVVVVGYGTQKKVSLTGSVAQINSKEIIKTPAGNISNALAGRLPGLVARQNSGQPGSNSSNIRIRGLSTTGDSSPIFIVDGIQRDFKNLDPNEIESISILKDASSAAIYGVQGAGGVVLITTRRGSIQKPQITVSSEVAYHQNTDFPKFLNGPDYVKYYNKARELDGLTPEYSEDLYNKLVNGDPKGKVANTDWFKEIMKNGAFTHHHNVKVTGGTERAKYFVSLSHLNEGAIVDKIDFKRYNLCSNLDVNLDHGFSLGVDLSARKEQRNTGMYPLENQEWNNLLTYAARTLPIVPIMYNDMYTSASFNNRTYTNPVAFNKKGGYNKSVMNVLLSSISLGWDVPWIQGLKLNVKYSYDKDYTTNKSWRKPFKLNHYDYNTGKYTIHSASIGDPQTQTLSNSVYQAERKTFQSSINYARTFGKNEIDFLLLYEQSEYNKDFLSGSVQDFDLTTLHEINRGKNLLGGADAKVGHALSGNSDLFHRAGYVSRLNYNYDNRYLLTLTARYDGSLRFPVDNRWGLFPGASVGWRISEEDFFKNLDTPIKNLKLRASIGKLGNDRIDTYAYLSLMNPNPPTVYFGNKEWISIYTTGAANKNITWETTDTYNVGLDFMLNKDVFGMELDYFYKLTNDILIGPGSIYPPSLGGYVPSRINGGKVSNKGFEIVLSHRYQIGGLNYSIRGNMSWSRNKVLRLNESPNIPDSQRIIGRKLGQKLGYIAEGLFQSEEEIMNSPTLGHLDKSNIRPGDIKYKDINGDGKITPGQDYAFVGDNNFPELMYGINLDVDWKNFDFSLFFQGAGICDIALSGWYYVNDPKKTNVVDNTQYTRVFYGNGNSPYFLVENSWMKPGDKTEFTRLTTQLNGNPNGWPSSWWLRDGSYIRLKNIQIGYTLRNQVIRNWGLDNIRISLTGMNLYTWSKLKKYGLDPEMPDVSNGYYPQQRIYQMGVSLTF